MSRERGVDIVKRERERVREEGRGGIESERVKRERYRESCWYVYRA